MRKALKIILPLVLVLILLVTAYWFFFQHRRDITAGVFRSFGDSSVEAGKPNAAIRWYGFANKLTPQDSELALKLAEAYRESGNYTKTEYVLVNAIYASPDCTELYTTLSKVYVEQDKLKDAQIMLDQIRNETVLAELSARRPTAPTVVPEGGYYSDRISVSLEPTADASCYMTTDGGYPSAAENPYSEPVELPLGETTVCAIAVGEDGLVSPAVYVGYTIAGVVEEAVFADPGMEAYVQSMLRRGDRKLKTNDLWTISGMDLPEDVLSLEDLHYFTGLSSLTIHNTYGSDLSVLTGLSRLKSLTLSGCSLTSEDLEAIGACTQLETLKLSGCGLSNLAPLENLTNLKNLDLSDNSINNLTPISGLTQLESLLLNSNALTSASALSKMVNLQVLNLSHNVLKSLSPLFNCVSMRELDVSHNSLTSLVGMDQMSALEVFNGSYNEVTDVDLLSVCAKLRQFTMTDNLLVSIDFLNEIRTIEDVNIDYNDVVAVPSFREDCKLVRFSAAHNFLDDLSGLAGLKALNYVNADYNNITDISVLLPCPNLTQVNVFGTYIHEGGELEANGVIVNYTPDVS